MYPSARMKLLRQSGGENQDLQVQRVLGLNPSFDTGQQELSS